MATVLLISEDKCDIIRHYVETSLDYVRMVEHKLTETLEKLENKDVK